MSVKVAVSLFAQVPDVPAKVTLPSPSTTAGVASTGSASPPPYVDSSAVAAIVPLYGTISPAAVSK